MNKPHNRFVRPLLIAFLFTLLCATSIAQQKNNDLLIKKLKRIKSKDSVENYAHELIRLAKKNHDVLFETKVLLAQSFKVYTAGNELKALDLAYQARALATEKDPATFTYAATMIAYLLNHRGKNVEALNAAFDILRITDARGWKKQGIECRSCVADLYRTMGESQKALPYALQASKDALSLRDTALYILSVSTLSNLYSSRELESPENFRRASKYLEILLAPPYINRISLYSKTQYLSNLGRLYQMQHQPQLAEKYLLQSLAISQSEKFEALEKHALNELMTVEIDLKNYHQAVAYGQKALNTQANAQSSRTVVRNIYHQLKRAYVGLNDYKTAFSYADKEQALNDSLKNIAKDKAAAELDEKYKADKRLLAAADNTRLATQQRNFTIVISLMTLLAIIAAYRWLHYKNRKEADLLNQQHQQLARMDAMKTRFFANISHELRTPLTLIIGPTEQLIDKAGLSDQQQSYLQAVLRNSKKLLNMVTELLDLGKIEAGSMPLKLKAVNLGQFVKVIYQGFASAAAFKQITFNLNSDIPDHEFVQLDMDKFEKIANNLISNAIKFTQIKGAVDVNASAKGDQIVFSVIDNGGGIHPDDLPHVFDRYYQGGREDATMEGGTGIGLALAREFTELMGGKITVESDWGKGTVFTVNFPKKAAASGLDVIFDQPYDDNTMVVESKGDQLVLLVEDHQEMAKYISSVIQPFYQVKLAGNGQEAINLLNEMKVLPDLIISDVMMPLMDGFALLNHLKNDHSFCRIPVIMLTALADDQHRLSALNIGVDDYITKPFLSTELLTRARNLINNAANRFAFSALEEQELAELNNEQVIPETEDHAVTDAPHSSPADLLWLADLERLVKTHIGKTDLNIAMLSYDMAISERQLFRRVKSITGLTPNKYIRNIRLQIARQGIESGKYRTVAEVSYVAGFDTPAYFSKLFKEYYGRDVNDLL